MPEILLSVYIRRFTSQVGVAPSELIASRPLTVFPDRDIDICRLVFCLFEALILCFRTLCVYIRLVLLTGSHTTPRREAAASRKAPASFRVGSALPLRSAAGLADHTRSRTLVLHFRS